MRYTAQTEMKMNRNKLRCLFLLQATEFRWVGADMKHEDKQRTPCHSVFNAFNANNECWFITNLLAIYANDHALCILCFVDRASLYNLLQMKPARCTLFLVYLFQLLYMCRATMCTLSGELTVIFATLVFYTLQTRQPPKQSEKHQCRKDNSKFSW